MNRHTVPLGHILDIPIGLDYSWFLIFVLLTWTTAVGYYPAEFKGWPAAQYWIVGAATTIMLFVSVLLHELGHSAVAMHYKIPVRSITLLIFGGISQIGAEVQQLALQDVMAGRKVSQAMNRNYTSVPADATLQHLAEDDILGSGQRRFVVKRGDIVIGLLTIHLFKGISRSDWPTMTAAQVMIPVEQVKRVRPDAELWSALEEMDRDGVNQLPVMTDGQIQGVLSREDVVGYLRTLHEIGAPPPEGR
jgi:CBS domain-containing protein